MFHDNSKNYYIALFLLNYIFGYHFCKKIIFHPYNNVCFSLPTLVLPTSANAPLILTNNFIISLNILLNSRNYTADNFATISLFQPPRRRLHREGCPVLLFNCLISYYVNNKFLEKVLKWSSRFRDGTAIRTHNT